MSCYELLKRIPTKASSPLLNWTFGLTWRRTFRDLKRWRTFFTERSNGSREMGKGSKRKYGIISRSGSNRWGNRVDVMEILEIETWEKKGDELSKRILQGFFTTSTLNVWAHLKKNFQRFETLNNLFHKVIQWFKRNERGKKEEIWNWEQSLREQSGCHGNFGDRNTRKEGRQK